MAVAAVAFLLDPAPSTVAQTNGSTTTTTIVVVVETVVTVEPGPARQVEFIQRCSDAIAVVEERTSFVLHRRGETEPPLTVTYRLSGSAQAGVHYEPLPGSVTFPAGSTSVVVDVVPRPTPNGALVDLTLEVTGGTPLAPPVPPSARTEFVSPVPPGPAECGYNFTSDPWNTAQTVPVGGSLHALSLEQVAPPARVPATGVFRLVGGALPPGVELRPDGSFGGAPHAPGTFAARIEACRPDPPGTCVTTELTVTVVAAKQGPDGTTPAGTLARTGPGAERWAILGMLGLALGALLVMWSSTRTRRDRQMS
ncbi:MAG: hypothetical protein M3179_05410 [Actinomycetota bacterium]|nr:hypothetical protein [Actinomycetota bacterium]